MKAFAAASLLLLLAGQDSAPPSLVLMLPPSDLVYDSWHTEALVSGSEIKKVVFLVDGKAQKTVGKQPFKAKLSLQHFPVEQTVRAEGYDAAGALVGTDEVILNQPRGALGLWILDPPKGKRFNAGKVSARAALMVPDGRRVDVLEWKLNDTPVARLTQPPWRAEIEVPAGDLAYITAGVTLDDGSHAEAVRFLKSPQYLEEVDVNLVELYVAVTDAANQPFTDLAAADLEVYEAGTKREIVKVEPAESVPWTVGFLLDTSRSMGLSRDAALEAAAGFLHRVLKPKDRVFTATFADRPHLETPPTTDLDKVGFGVQPRWEPLAKQRIAGAQVGLTALHDAIIQGLYYFRGIQGQRALVLLTDGGDNTSSFTVRDTLEYARRSGVVVYTIGFDLSAVSNYERVKLNELCAATGGRLFSIAKAGDLPGVYTQIEKELRSRYRVTYNSDPKSAPENPGRYRKVAVKVRKDGLKARTVSGTYR